MFIHRTSVKMNETNPQTSSSLMGDSTSSTNANITTDPWHWIIEYLSAFPKIDTLLLHDVIEAAPEMAEEAEKKTKEIVALRCLEELFGSRTELECGGGDPPFDLPQSCEEVLQSILQLKSVSDLKMGGAKVFEWDIRPFIQQKRASMTASTLEQLRDGTIKISVPHPFAAASFKEASQLVCNNDEADREPIDRSCWSGPMERTNRIDEDSPPVMVEEGRSIPPPVENDNGLLRDDLHNGNLKPNYRDRSCLASEEKVSADSFDDNQPNAKGSQQNLSYTDPSYKEVSPCPAEKQCVDDSYDRMAGDTGENAHCREKECEPHGLDLEGSIILERGPTSGAVDENLGKSLGTHLNTNGSYEPEHEQNQELPTTNKLPQDTNGDECDQYVSVNEPDNAEPRASTHTAFVETQQRDFVDEAKDKNRCDLDPPCMNGFHANSRITEAEGNTEHPCEEETSSDSDEQPHERVDVAMEKDRFLSSQCTFSEDCLATADWTQCNLCMKCNGDGELLVCSAVGCPLMVHESCLGSSAKYKSGNFYCPFCAYSLAISEFIEAKKKASLARKKLNSFISVECQTKNSERSFGKVSSNSRSNREEDPRYSSCRNGNVECSPAVAIHDNKVNDRRSENGEGNGQQVVPPVSSDAHLVSGEPKLTSTLSHTSSQRKSERKRIRDHTSGKEIDKQADHVLANPNCNNDASFKNDGVVSVKKRRLIEKEPCAEARDQKIADSPVKVASLTSVDHAETSADANDRSHYSRRSRSKDMQYTYQAVPQLRRKRVPWSAEEEEILKEGVQKLSINGDMPWRKILEYGSSVFWNGRTPIDLKDKWRNMCKGKS